MLALLGVAVPLSTSSTTVVKGVGLSTSALGGDEASNSGNISRSAFETSSLVGRADWGVWGSAGGESGEGGVLANGGSGSALSKV